MSVSIKYSPFSKKKPKHGFSGKAFSQPALSIQWIGSVGCPLTPGGSPAESVAYTDLLSDTLTLGVVLYADFELTSLYAVSVGTIFVYNGLFYELDNTTGEILSIGECYKPFYYSTNGCGTDVTSYGSVAYIQQVGEPTTAGYTLFSDPYASTILGLTQIYVDTNSDNFADNIVNLDGNSVITSAVPCST